MDNIVLIGMPGVGKSTVGVVLAKVLGYRFVDADILIQEEQGRLLKEIIEEDGIDRFIEIENDVNRRIQEKHTVIATGGSAVYGREAMAHLRSIARMVYLKLDYEPLSKRLGDLKGRGVVQREGQTLRELYNERSCLYEKYAHIIVNEEGLSIEETLQSVVAHLREEVSVDFLHCT